MYSANSTYDESIRQAGFGAVEHYLHRARRALVTRFFSRATIASLEGGIVASPHKLCDKILAHTSEPFDATVAYSNLTTDVVSGYCFGEGFGLLD